MTPLIRFYLHRSPWKTMLVLTGVAWLLLFFHEIFVGIAVFLVTLLLPMTSLLSDGWQFELLLPQPRRVIYTAKVLSALILVALALFALVPYAAVRFIQADGLSMRVFLQIGLTVTAAAVTANIIPLAIDPRKQGVCASTVAVCAAALPFVLMLYLQITANPLTGYVPPVVGMFIALVFYLWGQSRWVSLELAPSAWVPLQTGPAAASPVEVPSAAITLSERRGTLSPWARIMGDLLWFRWYFPIVLLLTAGSSVMALCNVPMMFGMVPSALFIVWIFSSLCLDETKKASAGLLTMPLRRERLFRAAFGPFLAALLLATMIAFLLAPTRVHSVRITGTGNLESGWVEELWFYLPEESCSPQAAAQAICDQVRKEYWVVVAPGEILRFNEGAPQASWTIDLAPVLPRLTSACRREPLLAGLALLAFVLFLLWPSIPGRRFGFGTTCSAISRWAPPLMVLAAVGFMMLVFYHQRDYKDEFLVRPAVFVMEHFYLAISLLAAFCILSWFRHERAFRYAEIIASPSSSK